MPQPLTEQHPLVAPVERHFNGLCSQYDFKITLAEYDSSGFGNGRVRLENGASDASGGPSAAGGGATNYGGGATTYGGGRGKSRYYLEFTLDGLGPMITAQVGRSGQPGVDLAWVFAYLVRAFTGISHGLVPGAVQPIAPWLYFYPHFTLSIWGEESINWQMARMADALQSLWPDIFLFLDMEGPRDPNFLDFIDRANRAAAERAEDGFSLAPEHLSRRTTLNFAPQVEKSFAFLCAYGYRILRSDPVFVRYEKTGTDGPDIYINIFHRLHSYQLGLQTGKVQSDPMMELNFEMDELAAWANTPYQPCVAQSSAELQNGLNRLARLFRRCARPLLTGDGRLFDALLGRRIDAARRASRAYAERSRW